METAQDIYGLSNSTCRHEETWWRNEEVAEAVREKDKLWKLEKRKLGRDVEGVQEE